MDDSLLEKIQIKISDLGTLTVDEIAKEFFKLPPSPIADKIVSKALSKNPIFTEESKGVWSVRKVTSPLISEEPLFVCYPKLGSDRKTILSISLWEVNGDEIAHTFTFTNPKIGESEHNSINVETFQDGLLEIYHLMGSHRIIFFSHYEQRLLLSYMLDCGLTLSDNSIPISVLFQITGERMTGQRDGLLEVAKRFITIDIEPVTTYQLGELLALLVSNRIESLISSGTITVKEFADLEKHRSLSAKWLKAKFTIEDILELEHKPGVYGFKNSTDEYIYIGKGKDVRSRLLTYFRISEESPQKLLKLREEAIEFTCHYCGSEVEALLLEYRLINRYTPHLNKQIKVNPNNKDKKRITPTIFLLPSFDEGTILTIWYNGKSNPIMKSFSNFESSPEVVGEVNRLFFANNENEESSELAIIERWLHPRINQIDQIDIESCGSANDVISILSTALMSCEGRGTIFRKES